MPIRVAIQMDPIGSIHLPSDSTFVLALEAMARGHELFTYQPDTLTWRAITSMRASWRPSTWPTSTSC